MNTRSKPTFVPCGRHLCLLSFLFAILLVCLLSSLFAFSLVCSHPCFYACHVYHICPLYASSICSLHFFLFIACLLVYCLWLCMYTHEARTHGARTQFSRRKQKRQGCKHVDLSQAAAVSRFRVQLFPLVMYSSKPLPSSSLSTLDGLYQVYHIVYHSSSSLEYDDPYLLSCTYILGHALGMQAFTLLLCVLALCMMYVYIYLLAPSQCDCHNPCHLRQSDA